METFCLGLLKAWFAHGVGATLYVSYCGGEREADVPDEVERVCWNVRAKKSFWKLAKWLRTRPDDPCLVLSQELAVVLLILKKSHLIRNRIYFRESSDVERHYSGVLKRIMRWLWPSLDGIIEQSMAGVEATRRICGGRIPKCMVLRNIMERMEVPRSVAVDGIVRLACVGSFKPMKGQSFLVGEMANDNQEDWALAFWGDGERRAAVERLVDEEGLAGRIAFHDWERDRSKIYGSCDVVVIPSDYEGLPNVMLEAILHGKRVSVRPTCVGACELLDELGIGETWPWRKALEIPIETWAAARDRLVAICNPEKVGADILSFLSR